MSAPTPTVSPELKALMRRLRLGQLLATLPEGLALARTHDLTHLEFLEQLFSDKVTRRDTASAGVRAGRSSRSHHGAGGLGRHRGELRPGDLVAAGAAALRGAGQQRAASRALRGSS